jgi:hypothetical protein
MQGCVESFFIVSLILVVTSYEIDSNRLSVEVPGQIEKTEMCKTEPANAPIPGASAGIGLVSGRASRRDQHVHLLVRKGEAARSGRVLPILGIPVSAELWSK